MSTATNSSEKGLDKRIAALESQLDELRKRKLAIVQERLREAQMEMNKLQGNMGGSAGSLGAAAGRALAMGSVRSRGKGVRGPRLSEEEVIERLTREVRGAGDEGISAREAAKRARVFYLRAIKVMDQNFKKSGTGKWTRYRM